MHSILWMVILGASRQNNDLEINPSYRRRERPTDRQLRNQHKNRNSSTSRKHTTHLTSSTLRRLPSTLRLLNQHPQSRCYSHCYLPAPPRPTLPVLLRLLPRTEHHGQLEPVLASSATTPLPLARRPVAAAATVVAATAAWLHDEDLAPLDWPLFCVGPCPDCVELLIAGGGRPLPGLRWLGRTGIELGIRSFDSNIN